MSGALAGRVVVVTGGGQGLGRAYAQRVADDGGTAVVADINIEAGEKVIDEFGALHGLVNNAAIFSTITMRPFWEIPIEEWDRLMAVNLRGPFLLTSALLPALRAAGDASIVNVASDAVWLGRSGYLHYVASKGGVTGMTYSMAHELGHDGIRVNAISPGPTYTEVPRGTVSAAQRQAMQAAQALHRDAGPEDMVGVVAFLLGTDSRFITGQVLSVSGGMLHR